MVNKPPRLTDQEITSVLRRILRQLEGNNLAKFAAKELSDKMQWVKDNTLPPIIKINQ